MRINKTVTAIIFSLGAALAAAGATAAEPANTIGCLHMSKQVSDAVDSHQQSDNLKAAQVEQQAGRTFCQSGVYEQGLAHYAKALQLLGVTGS